MLFLVLRKFYILCFDHIHPYPNSSQIHSSFTTHPTYCPFKKLIKFNLCCLYTVGCVSFHWSTINPQRDSPLRKINSPSPSSYQLLLAWLGVGLHAPILSSWILSGLTLHVTYVQSQLLSSCVQLLCHIQRIPFIVIILCLTIWIEYNDSWTLRSEGMRQMSHLRLCIPQSLVSISWPV